MRVMVSTYGQATGVVRILKAATYATAVFLFGVVALELSLRLVSSDPDFYFDNRFLFSSPDAVQNRAGGVWTYQPGKTLREAVVYFVPSLFPPEPRFVVEADCLLKTNNLGLLQERDVGTDRAWTVVLGDSFTAGQGGCPWFDRLQARWPGDNILNAGLGGTGVMQWDLLLKYLRARGLTVRRILVIAISNDFRRIPFNWKPAALNCLDRNVCPSYDDPNQSMQVRMDETNAELLSRSRARFVKRFGKRNWLFFAKLSVTQKSYLYKFLLRSGGTLKGMWYGDQKGYYAARLARTDAALESLKAVKVPIHVLMVAQRNEAGWLGNSADPGLVETILKAHSLAFNWCRIPRTGFLPDDMHPNKSGYDKLLDCADAALRGME
jgi:hypothetical protein